MKIIKLCIKKLFDLYDYDISFEEENITIITGPNGYGKTTILQIINSLNVGRLSYLYTIKFDSIRFEFDDGKILYIKQTEVNSLGDDIKEEDVRDTLSKEVVFEFIKEKREICSFKYNQQIIEEAIKTVNRYISIRHKSYRLTRRNILNMDDYSNMLLIDEEFGSAVNHSIASIQNQEQFLLYIETVQTQLIKTLYSNALHNRIYSDVEEERIEEVKCTPIEKIKKRLQEILGNAQKDYLEYSQKLDNDFINNLLKNNVEENGSREEYERLYKNVNTLMNELSDFGLVNKQVLPEFRDDNQWNNIIIAYLSVLDKKLNFENIKSLLKKLQLMDRMLQEKKFANKFFKITPQHGIKVTSVNGDFLDINTLSDGEQSEILLIFNLIFEVKENSILLIDEPENSLHVAWQEYLINDLLDVAKIKGLQIILATHSPTIVRNLLKQSIDLYYLQHETNEDEK